MGKRGPQPTSAAILKARGSPLVGVRKNKVEVAPRRTSPHRAAALRAKIISQAQMFSLIPGYDPRDQAGECRFDMKAARKAIDFFHKRLTHVKGQTGPFILEPWQQAILGNLFGWKRKDGTRRYREAFIYIPKKNGKMLDLNTELPTPTGWVTMRDIAIGDTLFDEMGNQCRVTRVSTIDPAPESYEIKFSNGEKAQACADHQWLTTALVARPGDRKSGITSSGRAGIVREHRDLTKVRTTREIYETQYVGRMKVNNHRIKMPAAIQMPEVELPIEPYLLGCWLGGGTSVAAAITSSELDAPHFVEELALVGCEAAKKTYPNRAPTLRLRMTSRLIPGVCVGNGSQENIQRTLRRLGLLGNKHIPASYLRASAAQRLSLLQGLMDTDGTADKRGRSVSYTTTSPLLLQGVRELLSSLGIQFRTRDRIPKLVGHECARAYEIQYFVAKDIMPVFRMKRKLDLVPRAVDRQMDMRSRSVMIVSVTPCNPIPMRCITVDSPSGLYRFGRTMLPTHNTFLASGLALYVLTEDAERGAECYGIAASKDQASLSFKYAAGMVKADQRLDAKLDVFGISGGSQQRSIVRKDDQLAFYRPLPADADTADGSNVHFVIADEIHRYPNGDLLDIMKKSTAARRQPLSVYITTADYDRPSACNNLLRRAKEVRDNKGDPNQLGFNAEFLPVVYEASRSEDWKSPEVWAKANPNLGVSLQQSFLEAECRKAIESPTEENSFKRFHLNILTEQAERWLQLDRWDACAGELDLEALRGAECWAGLDLSSTTDITALVLYFPSSGNSILPFFWIPQEGAELRSKRDRVPYPVWARGGLLEMTPGNVIDYAYIRAKVNSLTKIYNIREIAYDPWNATQIALELKEQDGLPMVEFRQGYLSMNEPCKELERLMTAGRLRHGGNPILRWMAGNVSKTSDPAGNIKIDKAKSVEKVDGMVGTVMALGRSMLKGGVQTGSVYDGRGLEVMG